MTKQTEIPPMPIAPTDIESPENEVWTRETLYGNINADLPSMPRQSKMRSIHFRNSRFYGYQRGLSLESVKEVESHSFSSENSATRDTTARNTLFNREQGSIWINASQQFNRESWQTVQWDGYEDRSNVPRGSKGMYFAGLKDYDPNLTQADMMEMVKIYNDLQNNYLQDGAFPNGKGTVNSVTFADSNPTAAGGKKKKGAAILQLRSSSTSPAPTKKNKPKVSQKSPKKDNNNNNKYISDSEKAKQIAEKRKIHFEQRHQRQLRLEALELEIQQHEEQQRKKKESRDLQEKQQLRGRTPLKVQFADTVSTTSSTSSFTGRKTTKTNYVILDAINEETLEEVDFVDALETRSV